MSPSTKRVAAIDCGTNSIRLLVADLALDGSSLTDVDRRLEIVRLGQGVDETRRLAPEALDRTFRACRTYGELIERAGATATRFVATSASRDAENRDEFVAGVRDILGVSPEVVSGSEEATLTFAGGTRDTVPAGAATPYLAVDIGGGSTEFVLGDPVAAERPRQISVDLGSVRLTERVLLSDPPTAAEVAEATAEVDARIDEAEAVIPLRETGTFVGLAGTVTTVAAMVLDLPAYQPEKIHRSVIEAGAIARTTERLLSMTAAERAALPFMHPGRADVIGAGALILDRIVRRVADRSDGRTGWVSGSAESALLVSEHDILDGIAWSLLT